MGISYAVQTPLLSIVVPTWNRETECLRLLSSLKPLGLSDNYEIIINDNNSSDNTSTYVKNYIKDMQFTNNIHFYENSLNIGPALNWLNGVKRASGKYILLLFSDDMLKFSSSFNEESFFNDLNRFAFSNVSLIRLGCSIVSSDLIPSDLPSLHYLPAITSLDTNNSQIESPIQFILNYLLPSKLKIPYIDRTFAPVSPTGYLIDRNSILNTLSRYSTKDNSFLRTGAGIDSLCILQSTLNSSYVPTLSYITALMVASPTSITAIGHKNRLKKLSLEKSYINAQILFLKNLFKVSPILATFLKLVSVLRYIKNIILIRISQK